MLNDKDLETVTGGTDAEINMLNLQSFVSKRSNLLAVVSNIMKSMSDTSKAIAGNIK